MPSPALFDLLGFLLGLLFGSFLNVCISRLPAHESIVTPRSRCAACGHTIRWYDNLPLLSWLILRARCRDCKTPISWRYPAVELAVGLLFIRSASILGLAFFPDVTPDTVASFQFSGPHLLAAISLAILGFLLIGLMVMDWQRMRLPDAFTLPGIALGFLLVSIQAVFLAPGEGDIVLPAARQLRLSSPGSFVAKGNVFLTGTEALVMGRVIAIAGAALLLLTIRWVYRAIRKRDGLGLGDVKLLAMIAAFLGFSQAMLALFAGVVSAALYGAILLARKRAVAESKLPLGSFLAAGGLFTALFGTRILGWYIGQLH